MYLFSFVETPLKFIIITIIIAIYYLRGVSTKLNKYIIFTMQTYKELKTCIYCWALIYKGIKCINASYWCPPVQLWETVEFVDYHMILF